MHIDHGSDHSRLAEDARSGRAGGGRGADHSSKLVLPLPLVLYLPDPSRPGGGAGRPPTWPGKGQITYLPGQRQGGSHLLTWLRGGGGEGYLPTWPGKRRSGEGVGHLPYLAMEEEWVTYPPGQGERWVTHPTWPRGEMCHLSTCAGGVRIRWLMDHPPTIPSPHPYCEQNHTDEGIILSSLVGNKPHTSYLENLSVAQATNNMNGNERITIQGQKSMNLSQ